MKESVFYELVQEQLDYLDAGNIEGRKLSTLEKMQILSYALGFLGMPDFVPEKKESIFASGNDYLLVEDSVDPMGRELFEKEMFEKYEILLEDFLKHGHKVKFGHGYKDFILQSFPDKPVFHLSYKD